MAIRVAVLGASGTTGRSVVNGLLDSDTTFEIIGLTRSSSLNSPANLELKSMGVKLVAVDLKGPEAELVKALTDIDVVVATINPMATLDQIPLANAAKIAKVKRFIPCSFATVVPPRGTLGLHEPKEDIIDHLKRLYLPYTIIDVGWWYQISVPAVPSGRTDGMFLMPQHTIVGSGDIPWARIDARDIGRYVARIIADERTLNKYVFAYAELSSQNEGVAWMEELSGETVESAHLSEEKIEIQLAELRNSPVANNFSLGILEYLHTQGICGYNTPDYARYLGYLNGKELYPDLELNTLKGFFQEVLDGKIQTIATVKALSEKN
ncbi:hypothetical protein V8C42DRAFT_72867 [Trichoderma barbatum]